MANKKNEIGEKPKAAPAVTPLEAAQKTNSKSKVPPVTPEPALEKVEKGKKAQAAKKASKEQKMLVKEPTVLSKVKANNGEAKDRKVKEAKVKKQVTLEPVTAEPVATESIAAGTTLVSKKGTSEPASEKATKMKRLTLDIAKPLHKAIKAQAVEEGIPMVDMLRSLLEKHYSK